MKLGKRIRNQRVRRRHHVRNVVRASGRLRLSVYRSNRNVSAQIIDDETGRTLVSASSLEKELGGAGQPNGGVDCAQKVGQVLGARAIEAGIKEVAFDRGSSKYHGRIAAIADAVRAAGIHV